MEYAGFNPKARWDRHIPANDDLEPKVLNENIEVLVWFKRGKIYPQEFLWNNKTYAIKQITYYWQERRGQEIITYFTVNTDPDLYQISFNNTSLSWKLDKVIDQ